jgi:hypothetical protein
MRPGIKSLAGSIQNATTSTTGFAAAPATTNHKNVRG